MKRANSCWGCRIEASGRGDESTKSLKAGAQVADLRRAGWPVTVQEGKPRRHREVSGVGTEARPRGASEAKAGSWLYPSI